MGTLITQCPHCDKDNVAFISILSQYITEINSYITFFTCGNCNYGLVAHIIYRGNKPGQSPNPHEFHSGINTSNGFIIVEIYPKPVPIDAPAHVPDNIRNFYLQSIKSFRNELWDASALMSRKVIEAICKHLDPGVTGDLKKRIEKLAASHIITDSMKEWAHEIRLEGNSAAHDELPFSKENAKDLLSFSELFLMYVFTLPCMLATRRATTP